MLDEPALVACGTPELSQVHFQRCQGTDCAAELDEYPPGDGGDVDPNDPGPAHREGRSQYNKQYKCEVDDQNPIRGQAVDHWENAREKCGIAHFRACKRARINGGTSQGTRRRQTVNLSSP